MKIVIWDSDILLELLAGNPDALKLKAAVGRAVYFTCITYAEVLAGAANKQSQWKLQTALQSFIIVDLDATITPHFTAIIEKYLLSHNQQIPDALIAATALAYDIELATCNTKHFRYIAGIKLAAHSVTPTRRKKGWF